MRTARAFSVQEGPLPSGSEEAERIEKRPSTMPEERRKGTFGGWDERL